MSKTTVRAIIEQDIKEISWQLEGLSGLCHHTEDRPNTPEAKALYGASLILERLSAQAQRIGSFLEVCEHLDFSTEVDTSTSTLDKLSAIYEREKAANRIRALRAIEQRSGQTKTADVVQ